MSANDDLFDALVRHQIGLMRLSGSLRNRMLELLDRTERDLVKEIRRRDVLGRDGTLSASRLRALRRTLAAIRGAAWDETSKLLREELLAIARAEAEFLATATRTVAPVVVTSAVPPAALLREAVLSRPFEGRILREWSQGIRRADIDRINAQVQIGLVQGESSQDIARRVVGTVRRRGADGVTQITRHNAAALARTAVNAVTNQAKRAFFEANSDIFDEELYVATLDARTTPVCRSLDGKTFPVGEGPIPPLHFSCRSLRVAVLDGEVLGRRPTKSSTDRQLLREYTESNDLARVTSRGALPRGHRGRFDAFSRRRVRELTGDVPARVNYEQFLRRQSREFQNEVLGVTKARLFRRGGLTLDRFVDRRGDELTLQQLARTDAEAFRRAGLDPDNFR